MEKHNHFFEDDDDSDQSKHLDLIAVQRTMIQTLLNLTPEHDDEDTQVTVGDGQSIDKHALTFKVLVFDQGASNITATIMKVGNLRDSNVTLHLSIYAKRDQIQDIPAVYMIYEPSIANFKKIAQDAMNGTYDYMFINFLKPIASEQLDQFAYEMAKTNATHKICRVQAHFMNYQVIAPNLFTLPEHSPVLS